MPSRLPILVVVIALALAGHVSAADAPVASADLNASVVKALPPLTKGALGHRESRSCFACHSQALPVLAMTTARDRGVTIDSEELTKQLDFIAEFLSDNRANYLEGKGQGGQADTAGYALVTLDLGGWKPDETTAAVAHFLLQRNADVGHWRANSQRPPTEGSNFTVTYVALRGLTAYRTADQQKPFEKRREQVRQWLVKTPAKENEDRVFRLLGLKLAEAQKSDSEAAVKELAGKQREDGGWAQLDGGEPAAATVSDAYATGSALVALHHAGGMSTSDPAYQRGLRFLLKTQQPDGTWHVVTRSKPIQKYFETGFPHGKDQFISSAATGWAATALALAIEAGRPVTLIENGTAKLPIIGGSVKAPVTELHHHLRRMTGATFESKAAARGQAGIHIGLIADFPWLKIDRADELGAEGFVIQTSGDSLYLVAAAPAGVQHAVTTFLHRLGCRWYFPGAAWEIVPQRKTIAGIWNERHMPAFPTQRRIWYGFGAYPSGQRDLDAWTRHNRLGGPVDVSIGHTWHGLNPDKDFAAHPDWFALVDGKRQPAKPCYTHPQVLERAIESALMQAKDGRQMISMTPPDGLGYCECERCLATLKSGKPFREHGSLFAKRDDGTVVNITSESLFGFVNQVAAAVAAKHPKTLIGCYAYSAYSHPPSFDLHPNVYLQTTTAYRRTSISLDEQLAAFGKKTKQLGIREYYSIYQWDWDYPSPGKMTPATLAMDLKQFHRNKITAINAESSNNWAARGLGYYVASQLMWDVDADVKAIVRDFYENAFGPAALPMQRYYARWYGPSAVVLPDDRAMPAQVALFEKGKFEIDALKAAYQDLDDAAKLVPADSAYRVRIDLLRMYAHYLFLRHRLHQAEQAGDRAAIIDAIKQETIYGGRLTDTHMIHTRPLLGKAFLRRFKPHEALLKDIPDSQETGKGWRQIGAPPTTQELEKIWSADKAGLGPQ